MKKYFKLMPLLLIIIISIVFMMLLKGTKSVDQFVALTQVDKTKAKQALINEAYALYYRGTSFNYDDNDITYLGGFVPSDKDSTDPNYNAAITHKIWKRRSSYFHQPEEATPQDTQYLVCSEFILNTYRNAFVDQHNNGFMLYYSNDSQAVTNDIVLENDVELENEQVESDTVTWGTYRFMRIARDENNSMHYLTRYYYNVDERFAEIKDETGCEGDECYSKLENVMQDEIKSQLLNVSYEIGDVIVYRSRKKDKKTASGGHIMLYVSKSGPNGTTPTVKKDRYLLHSTGSSYRYGEKYDSHINEPEGTVQQITLEQAIAYVLKSGVSTSSISTEIAVLRPLDAVLDAEAYAISNNTTVRGDMPELVRTKTASVEKHESVNLRDYITYTVTLENRSANSYSGISISDYIPTNTTYVSSTPKCTKNGNHIEWQNITLAAGEVKEYSYTVKVNDDAPLGSEIVSDQTIAAGIKMNTIKTMINKTLTPEVKTNLVNRVKNTLKDKEYSNASSSFEFIKDAYSGIINIDFGNSTVYVQNLLKKFYNITDDDIYVLKQNITEDKFTKMYVNNLFGGYYTTSENQYNLEINSGILDSQQPLLFDGRELTYNDSTLMIGDVILLYDKNYADESYAFREYNAYLCLGYNESKSVVEFATIDANKKVKIVDSKLGQTNRSRLLESLPGQNAFIVLRPSYAMADTAKGDINLDGVVNIKDALILVRYIINGTSEYNKDQLLAGDMNNDGKIKLNDVTRLIKSYK